MRLHILSLPHTQTTKEYISCAYTQKAMNFSNMMMGLDYECFLYASEDNDANCTELVTINSKSDQERWFGDFDYHNNFYPITWGVTDAHWLESNSKAINEISKRIQPGDFICIIAGICQEQIAEAFPTNPTIEYGIGYDGVTKSSFRVFESYSHMHNVYGQTGQVNGRYYDCVIPNYFDPADFRVETKKQNYYAYLGRFTSRKGVEIAVEVTKQLGAKLVMAGQGCTEDGGIFKGENVRVTGKHLSHIGHVDAAQRTELLANAKALFVPTVYLEPFGGVAVEAMFCGTPVIASDFGAFTETVPHGVAGYRFRTVGEAAFFASDKMLKKLSPYEIAAFAHDNFSMERVAIKYDDFFHQIAGLYDGTVTDFYSPLFHGRENRYSRG